MFSFFSSRFGIIPYPCNMSKMEVLDWIALLFGIQFHVPLCNGLCMDVIRSSSKQIRVVYNTCGILDSMKSPTKGYLMQPVMHIDPYPSVSDTWAQTAPCPIVYTFAHLKATALFPSWPLTFQLFQWWSHWNLFLGSLENVSKWWICCRSCKY